jgi:hypothetical protein
VTFSYYATDREHERSAAETATVTVSQAPAISGPPMALTVPILMASSVNGENATGAGGRYHVAGHAALFDGLDDAVVRRCTLDLSNPR